MFSVVPTNYDAMFSLVPTNPAEFKVDLRPTRRRRPRVRK